MVEARTQPANLITAQLIYSKLSAICSEMGESLIRLGRSPLISEDRAFAVGLLDSQHRLAVQHQGDFSHFFALRDTVFKVLDYFAFNYADGDIFICSDPYTGGTVGNILTICEPIFVGGENIFTVAVRVPMLDFGGELPGSLQPHAVDIWQETLRVTPTRLVVAGKIQKDLLSYIVANSRAPTTLRGDLEAAIAVLAKARRDIQNLAASLAVASLPTVLELMYEYTSAFTKQELRNERSGVSSAKANLQLSGDLAIEAEARIEYLDSGFSIFLSTQSDDCEHPYYLTEQATKAVALATVCAPVLDDVAINEGLLQLISIKNDNAPLFFAASPQPVSLGLHRTADCLSALLSQCTQRPDTSKLQPYGSSSKAVIYAPIGTTKKNPPFYLEPGFPMACGGWGAPSLRGVKQLASVEELEATQDLRIVNRERNDHNAMIVSVENIGPSREITTMSVPNPGAPLIKYTTYSPQASQEAAGSFAKPFPKGATLEFTYPAVEAS